MPYFVIVRIARPDVAERRSSLIEAHHAYLASYPGVVRLAGPFLETDGKNGGAMMVIEAQSLEAAKTFGAADPFVQADLFERIEFWPWRPSIGQVP